MNHRERILTACRHEQPDRVPLQVYLTPEIHQQLVAYFGEQDLMEVLGIDLRGVGAPYTAELKPGPGMPGKADSYDEFGVGYSAQAYEGGVYYEASELALKPLKTTEEVDSYPWPSAENYDYSVIPAQCEALKEYATCLGGAGIPDILNGVSRWRGMEQVMIDIAMQDPVGVAIIDHRVDYYYEYCKKALEAGEGKIDILCLGEDCGNQNGRMFSPPCFNNFFVPRIKQFIDLAHEHGALAMMHSCGDTHDIISTFIEMGLDILDAMQPEPVGMNPEYLKREFGRDITFCGLVSTQQTLPHGTAADVRREVRHRIDVVGKDGGYICSPAHCIQPDTPLENVLALYSEALGVDL